MILNIILSKTFFSVSFFIFFSRKFSRLKRINTEISVRTFSFFGNSNVLYNDLYLGNILNLCVKNNKGSF